MSKADDPRDEELSALYRATQEETPSAGLDARILAAARATAIPQGEVAPASRPGSWTQRWRIPVALAATVLMTLTLTLLVREHEVDGIALHAPKPRTTEVTKDAAPPAPAPATRAPAPKRVPERKFAAPAREAAVDASAPPAALSAPASAQADRSDRAEERLQAGRPARSGKLESTPDQWLAEVRRLRSEGRTAEAAERLEAFKKRYPDFQLPEDMREP